MIDEIQLHFEPSSLIALNVVLALIMFGVSLDLTTDDFKRIARQPRGVFAGLLAQLFGLPALTVGLAILMQPPASVAMGMLLVASCPGGNVSNFLTHVGGGNTGLSVTITTLASLSAIVATPINFALWGPYLPGANVLLTEVGVEPATMFVNIVLVLATPLVLGIVLNSKVPALAARLRKPMRWFSLVALAAFIGVALYKNRQPFIDHVDKIFVLVLVHNAIAFALGWLTATGFRLKPRDRRAVTMEVGIQNSGLGLVLIFTYFDGLGGMAVIAAWWGVWHMVGGGSLAAIWSWRDRVAGRAEPAPEG